jgi:signal transduction histidine kinase
MITMDVHLQAQDGYQESDPSTFPRILERCLASGLLALDQTQRIGACTTEAAHLLGLDPCTAIGQGLASLPATFREVLERTLRDGRGLPDHHLLLESDDAGPRTVRVATTPIQSQDGRVVGVIAVLNDVTPARRLEENLRHLDRLASIGTLSASMAHEIKNAMVAIKTFVDLLIKKNQEAALADIVGREMRRIDSIVSQMLRFGGPAKPTFGVIQLHGLLDESLGLVQHHLEGRRIKVLRDFRAGDDALRGDVYQLQQAFLNLFFNALEAMGASGELAVTTELLPLEGAAQAANPMLRVTVRDTGMGIATENLDRLFDPFFTTKPNGTGLGLPITRRIIQEHRGQVTVESELNAGTTFTILLPFMIRRP